MQFNNYLINKETFAHSINPSHICNYPVYNNETLLIAEDYVDLGLPSGTKWAKCNIGANAPEEAGLYFAWGETQGYTAEQIGEGEGQKAFSWDDYKWGKYNYSDANRGMTKYQGTGGTDDQLVVLLDEDDAAYQATNGKFRMPTHEQQVELFNNTNKEWTTLNGVSGYKFTNKIDNTKFIFVPAVGYDYDGSLLGVGLGNFWSSSLYSDDVGGAWYSSFGEGGAGAYDGNSRYCGQSVRGVLVQ